MNLKHFFYAVLLTLFLTGCASTQKVDTKPVVLNHPMEFETTYDPLKDMQANPIKITKRGKSKHHQKQNYVGSHGYLSRPGVFAGANFEKAFNRCNPIEILGLYQKDKTIFLYAKQNNYTFILTGINRKSFEVSKNGNVPLLDQYFVNDLSQAGLSQRSMASEGRKACAGETWKDMLTSQFQFVIGDPERRQPMKTAQGQFDVWTYKSGDQSQERHYYFMKGRLYSWTR